MLFGKIKTKHRGFTLVEALIFSLILVIVAVDFYRTMSSGLKVLSGTKAKIAASQVANEKFEILRNISYENLTTDAAHIGGHVTENETISRSGVNFNVNTEIRYVDDDYDGTSAESTDTRPEDYKQVEIVVSWSESGETKNIKMVTHMAPPGTEELYNGGILNIEIRQSDGTPVQGALVSVRNAATNASIYSGTTAIDGKIYLIGLTPGDELYKVSVSKNGFEDVVTVPPFNQTWYDPVPANLAHASVFLAGISTRSIIFDPLANVRVLTEDPVGNPIGNIDFSLEGGRVLGATTTPPVLPVYFYAKTSHQSDALGIFSLSDKSPGRYIFEYPSPATGINVDYDFWKVNPSFGGSSVNFFANPGITTDVSVLLLPKNIPSLFLKIVDKNDNNPISDAKVTVKNTSLSYEKDATTDQFGQVYFPKKEGTVEPLQNVEYEINVQAAGYQDKNENVTVLNLTKQDIQIEP